MYVGQDLRVISRTEILWCGWLCGGIIYQFQIFHFHYDWLILWWIQISCVVFRRPTSLPIKLAMRSFNLATTFMFSKHTDMDESSPVSSGFIGSRYTLLVLNIYFLLQKIFAFCLFYVETKGSGDYHTHIMYAENATSHLLNSVFSQTVSEVSWYYWY